MTSRPVYRYPAALLLAAVFTALCLTLSACSTTPQDMTVHGTVTLTTGVNGVPPLEAFAGYDATLADIPSQVTITADDGPGNYQGQPWNQVTTDMTLKSATAKVIVYTFTAQVPDDADMYQITAVCCERDSSGQDYGGQDFTLQEMQQGPAVCAGAACPGF